MQISSCFVFERTVLLFLGGTPVPEAKKQKHEYTIADIVIRLFGSFISCDFIFIN